MNKDSLEKAADKIIQDIETLDINIYDKMELLLNLKHFLDVNKYENNIKVLKKVNYEQQR